MQVGLVLPVAEEPLRGGAPSFAETRATAEQAEALGFDSVWVWDHLLHRFPGHPEVGFHECWTTLTALAAVTRRVKLGTLVLCGAFRNPALVAKMATTLNDISGGRLLLGLGCGWHQPEFDAFGVPFDHRVGRFEEALGIIAPLLRDGAVDFAGTFHQARSCVLRPPPAHPTPIMVAATGPRMLRLAARFADLWNVDWLGPVERVAEHAERLRHACEAEGRDPATLGITGGLTVAFPELGRLPSWMHEPDDFLTGSSAELAEHLRAYQRRAVRHVMCTVYPYNAPAVERLGQAVRLLHQ